jgi:hypothetical protein
VEIGARDKMSIGSLLASASTPPCKDGNVKAKGKENKENFEFFVLSIKNRKLTSGTVFESHRRDEQFDSTFIICGGLWREINNKIRRNSLKCSTLGNVCSSLRYDHRTVVWRA